MVLLDKLWDDVLAGGEGEGSSSTTGKFFQRSISIPTTTSAAGAANSPGTPTTPVTPSTPTSARKVDNVWRSVFHPGSNLATRGIGSDVFDKPQPNSPTVYDWFPGLHGLIDLCFTVVIQGASIGDEVGIGPIGVWEVWVLGIKLGGGIVDDDDDDDDESGQVHLYT
ncbi:Dormancyauxin associated [Macleaya cordata]|uniref:Dormancyauxin associated n=1 Tax=Macleaya cordata TaxID=56857 RepID=A0A200PQ86_MACCD|nr:Dormancyauxin associated [Macleaya cordata]